MSISIQHRLISFAWTPSGGSEQRIWLVAQGSWTVTGGLTPDTNPAACSHLQYDLLPANKQNLLGKIELWGTTAPPEVGAAPDIVLQNQTLVSVTIEQWGIIAGESSPRVITYRLAFADHRHGWLEPRGGRITRSQVNVDATVTLEENATLAQQCLDAMGAGSGAPSTMNTVSPMRNLDWRFTHAPSELSRLLEHTGHTYCPDPPSGMGSIQMMLSGGYPTFPAGRVISDLTLGVVDRRASQVIFSSAPASAVRTYDADAANPPAWNFVAQDPDDGDKWKVLNTIAQIGVDPIEALRNDLPNATDEGYHRLKSQMFKCVQIDQTRFPSAQCSILRKVFRPDGSIDNLSVRGVSTSIARRMSDGAWRNMPATIEATSILPDDGVVVFDERAIKVEGNEAGDLDPFAILGEDFQIIYSIEDWDIEHSLSPTGIWGFSLTGGVVTPMDESTARSSLTGYRPETAIFHFPELVPIKLNDTTDNSDELATQALSYAKGFLAGDTATAREVHLTGFYPISIGARVSRVEYDLDSLLTVVTLDGWALPLRSISSAPKGQWGRQGGFNALFDQVNSQFAKLSARASAGFSSGRVSAGFSSGRVSAGFGKVSSAAREGFDSGRVTEGFESVF